MTVNAFDSDRGPELPRRRRRGSGGGRRDPSVMVPDAQFSSYYGRHIVKPAPWGHEIPAYFFLGGLAAGSGLIGAWGHARGYDVLRRNSRLGAMAAVALSGGALVADLGRPERFLNMMRTMKLTSPMSVGTWIFTAFSASAGVALAAEAAGWLGLDQGNALPQKAIGAGLKIGGPLSSIGSAAFSAPLAAYTAVLVSDTATPLWQESYRELPFVFTGSALAASCGLAMITTPAAQTGEVRRLALMGAATDVTAYHLMARRLGELAEPLEHGRPGWLARAAEVLTIGGAVGATVFGRNRIGASLSGLALLAGSACTRFAVFEAGIESAKDPKYTVIHQKARLAARRAAGLRRDAITTA